MGKIKLSIIADAASPTGFATVTHNVASYLQDIGEYDIKILGINYHGKPNQWSKKFDIYPAILGGDPLGIAYAPEFINETKPDVVWLFQDFWNIPYYSAQISQLQPVPKMVAYYPVDSPNIKGQFITAMAGCVSLGTYTKFGVAESVRGAQEAWDLVLRRAAEQNVSVLTTLTVELLRPFINSNRSTINSIIAAARLRALRKPEEYFVIPHGVDNTKFYQQDKKTVRESFGFPENAFIIGNINRNQSRKRLDLSIKAFAKFAKDKPNAYLLLHAVRDDPQGLDLPQLIEYYGVVGKVILTHVLFAEKTATIEELNFLYNVLDVQINTCGGEGFGLTSAEGAACKIPQVVPNWSATGEIWAGAAKLIDVIEVRHEPSGINTAQAIINVNHLITILNEFYEDPTKKEEVGNACYEVIQRPEYQWENVGEQFNKIFKEALAKEIPKATPIALNPQGALEIKKAMAIRKEQ